MLVYSLTIDEEEIIENLLNGTRGVVDGGEVIGCLTGTAVAGYTENGGKCQYLVMLKRIITIVNIINVLFNTQLYIQGQLAAVDIFPTKSSIATYPLVELTWPSNSIYIKLEC